MILEKGFSVVVPLYNEKESIKELLAKLTENLLKLRKPYEIIFIDDGSDDGSLDILKSIEGRKHRVKIFSFRKNLGKSYALMLGFKMAKKSHIITMDADLQDDPKNISLLYEKMIRGEYDMVSGWRKKRKDNPLKKISSRLFNELVSKTFDIDVHDLNSGLKIYKAEVAKELKLYGGMHRFIPLLVKEMGFKVGEKEIVHHSRKYGQSKYKMTKVLTDIPDLLTVYFLTKYTGRPLHFFGKIGLVIFLLGFIILTYLSYLKILGQSIGGRPLLLFGVLLVIAGIQTIFTGLLADLIVNSSSKNENVFPVRYVSNKVSL